MVQTAALWTELPTETTFLGCRAPFSFFFDLVRPLWKGPGYPTNVAFHRLCTLARKMGAQTVVVSCALHRTIVREDIDDLDAANNGGGAAEAIDISFFSELIEDESRLPKADPGSLIGRSTLINYKKAGSIDFDLTYVFEAIFRVPRLLGDGSELLNNYIHTRRRFDVEVCKQTFSLNAVYYCQQNSVTGVCAHACLRMALNSVDPSLPVITTRYINQKLGLVPPAGGLNLLQIEQILGGLGFKPFFFAFNPQKPDPTYMRTLYSVVESGCPALLVFSTANQGEAHIVPVFGHTLNSDEWHPFAHSTASYSGPASAPYYSSSAWADHFLAHDDNFGPYYCLSNMAFTDIGRSPQTPWAMTPLSVIGLFPDAVQCSPLEVEGVATAWLNAAIPHLKTEGRGRWWDYMNERSWPYVLRTFLIERALYEAHLQSIEGHDGSRLRPEEIAPFIAGLPDRFWISEFTMPALYAGNKSKLGEILFDASKPVDPAHLFEAVLAMRAPSLLIKHLGGNNVAQSSASLESHSQLFRRVEPGLEW